MARKLLESTDKYDLYHHTGNTVFTGCQCFKDCNCNERFKSTTYNYYTVKKKFNKIKTTLHNTIAEAKIRIEFLLSISNN